MTEKKKRERGTAYLLERIPPDVYRAAQERAQRDGHPLRFVLIKLLERYARDGL